MSPHCINDRWRRVPIAHPFASRQQAHQRCSVHLKQLFAHHQNPVVEASWQQLAADEGVQCGKRRRGNLVFTLPVRQVCKTLLCITDDLDIGRKGDGVALRCQHGGQSGFAQFAVDAPHFLGKSPSRLRFRQIRPEDADQMATQLRRRMQRQVSQEGAAAFGREWRQRNACHAERRLSTELNLQLHHVFLARITSPEGDDLLGW